MTQLAANREDKFQELGGIGIALALAILDTEKMYYGGIVCRDYADEIQMGADTQGLKAMGVCPKAIDNTDDGETLDHVLRGILPFNNSATYPIPRSAIGENAYIEDDNTVGGWSTNLVPAGKVHDVDADFVWVDMRPDALGRAWADRPPVRTAKTDDYTVTAAIAFDGRTYFACDKASIMEITLPSAVAGMRVGVQRIAATAAHDLTVQAAAADRIQASDGICAAAKQIDNTVDAISEVLWLRAVDDTFWMIDNPYPKDVGSWVLNDA